jgi:hypothetical protein
MRSLLRLRLISCGLLSLAVGVLLSSPPASAVPSGTPAPAVSGEPVTEGETDFVGRPVSPPPPPVRTGTVVETDSGIVRRRMDVAQCNAPEGLTMPRIIRPRDPARAASCGLCMWDLMCPATESIRGITAPPTQLNVRYSPVCAPVGTDGNSCPSFTQCHLSPSPVYFSNNISALDRVTIRMSESGAAQPRFRSMRQYMRQGMQGETERVQEFTGPNGEEQSIRVKAAWTMPPDSFHYNQSPCAGQGNYCVGDVDIRTRRSTSDTPVLGSGKVVCRADALNQCPSATECLMDHTFAEPTPATSVVGAPAGASPVASPSGGAAK